MDLSRACDVLSINLDVARKNSKQGMQKKPRIDEGVSRPFTAEQMQYLEDMQLLLRRLVTEGRIAQRLSEARDKLVDNKEAAYCSGMALHARLSALYALQGKALGHHEELDKDSLQRELALRSVFGGALGQPACRPFLTLARLQELQNPFLTQHRMLRGGDVLHVPISQEECQVLVKHLASERPLCEFDARLLRACQELPGRTLPDLHRFLSQLHTFVTRHHTDQKLLRKVVVFDERTFVRSAAEEVNRSVHSMLNERALGNMMGASFSKRAVQQTLPSVGLMSFTSVSHYTRMIGNPTDVKFSPEGARKRWLVVGSSPSKPWELLLFHLDARRNDEPNLTRLYGHKSGVITEIQWSSNGSFIASSGFDSFVRIWDPETGNQRACKKQMHAVHGVVTSKQQENVVASRAFENMGNSTELRVWNVENSVDVDLGENFGFLGHVEQSAFFGARDENLVVVTDGSQSSAFGEVVMWNWEAASKTPLLRLRPHDGGITCVDALPGGRLFCTGGNDRRVALVDVRVGHIPAVHHMFVPLSNSRLRPEFQGVTFSSCGTLIAAASNRNDIVIFDVRASPMIPLCQLKHKYPQSGFAELPATEENDLQGAYRSCWAPHAPVLVSGGEDGCIRLWDCNRNESEMNIKTIRAHSQCVSALDISWCGQAIASGADDLRVGLYTTQNSTLQMGNMRRKTGEQPIAEIA